MARSPPGLDFCILGPLEVFDDGRAVPLGRVKQRALLGLLLLHPNETLSTDRLIDELWGERRPASAANALHARVSRLRKALAGDNGSASAELVVTRERGYELRLDPERLDAHRFERLVAEGRGELAAGRRERAVSALERALSLWRGAALADLADERFAQAEIARLEDLRVAALEKLFEAKLALGRHADVVGQLETLIGEHPYREGLRAQLMLALYRCDRQADALQAYQGARRTLIEELGIEPGERLRELERTILAQDPSLAVPAQEPAELPPELGAETLLAGRDAELAWLREHWRLARGGAGRLVLVTGETGMGKTRMAAEVAGDVHREGAAAFYAAGTGAPEAALAVIVRTRAIRRPALVVLDDADRAPAEVRAALRELAPALGALPVLVLATGQEAAALVRLEPHESLVLEPLDAASVHAIAGIYAPAGGPDTVPVETLLATSRGIPRRVHEAASAWARHEATRRVDAAADRAAASRGEARALDAELAGSVVELQAARERADLVARDDDDAEAPVVCPYKGLATFDSDDTEYFFGRERLVAELVARLVGARLLTVVGPSGSGKSSVLRAGLLPALAGGVLPASENWTQALVRPGEHPMHELRRATRRLARERRSILAVDQFEELFTACQDEHERGEFVATLVRGARDRDVRCVVVLAVRADFYGRCAAYPELSSLLGANHVLVGPMSRDELRRAIERPAERVGLSVDPELVEALLTDVEGRPGALPLLSTALLELWRERDGRRLRLAAYARSGGVQGAVARLAEDVFAGLNPAQQEAARRLLLRLTDEDESGALVRRRIGLAEVDADVASRLADRRLLTIDDGTVEVAHEALLREWPRLRGWLDEDVEGRRVHRRLIDAARAWDTDARDPGALYRGARLATAADWAADHDRELNATERAFLDESRRASGRAQRRLRMVLAGVTALLVLAVIAGVVALDQRGRARAEATAAAAQRLGAQALADDDLDHALLLARQGVALDDTIRTRGNLLATVLKSPAAIGVIPGDGGPVTALDLSPDDRTLAFIDADGTLSRIDTRTRRPIRPLTVPRYAYGLDVRFSKDGARLAIGGQGPHILDARTRRVTTDVRTGMHTYAVRFSPDRRTLFAIVEDFSGRALVRRFDARSGLPLGIPRYITRAPNSVTLIVTRDGRRVVTSFAGGRTVIRDARTLLPVRQLPVGAERAALGSDDRTLLVGGRDGSVRFVDLVTGRARTGSGRHDGAVTAAAFSADGRTAVTGGQDNHAIVWDVEHAAAGETLEGHSGVITGVVISRDGRTLYTASRDGKVLIWDLTGDRRLARPFDIGTGAPAGSPRPPIASHALSPDGRILAIGHPDGTVALIDARTLRERSRFRAVPNGQVFGMAYVPGGRLLAVGGDAGFLALFDPRRGDLIRRLRGHTWPARMPSFSADGRLMATTSADAVLLWTLRSGKPVGPPRKHSNTAGVGDAALSPDGRTLAVASPLRIEILDAATLRSRTTIPILQTAMSVRFTPDGHFLAVGRSDGSTQLWSTETWRPAPRLLAGHTAEVLSIAASPDGRRLATGSWDGTIRLFDLRTLQPLGAPLRAVPNRVAEPHFTPGGAYLFAITDAGRAYRWDIRPSSWARRACEIAGRRLTRTEWIDVLPERDYAPAC